jgi:hypothetical protein
MKMPQVAIEYMIMVPILIAQIFLFPYVASIMMNNWTDARRTIAIQEAASCLSSSMQQLYSSMNHDTITNGTVTYNLGLPLYIENYPYIGNATLRTASSDPNGSRILEITLRYSGIGISTTAIATFGGNMQWKNSTFFSNSTSAGIVAEKYWNVTTQMSMIRMQFAS